MWSFSSGESWSKSKGHCRAAHPDLLGWGWNIEQTTRGWRLLPRVLDEGWGRGNHQETWGIPWWAFSPSKFVEWCISHMYCNLLFRNSYRKEGPQFLFNVCRKMGELLVKFYSVFLFQFERRCCRTTWAMWSLFGIREASITFSSGRLERLVELIYASSWYERLFRSDSSGFESSRSSPLESSSSTTCEIANLFTIM